MKDSLIPDLRVAFVTLAFMASVAGCESNRVTETVYEVVPPPSAPSVFTTIEVTPSVLTMDERTTVQLGVSVRDQRGAFMTRMREVTFSSTDRTVADVTASGMVKGIAAGTAEILVTTTIGAVTLSAVVKTTVNRANPLDSVLIRADPERGWQPSVAHLKAGGTVRWVTTGPLTWSGELHGMLYLLDKGYAIVDSLDLSSGTATLKLMTPGDYNYCSGSCWDPPDFGVIHVH